MCIRDSSGSDGDPWSSAADDQDLIFAIVSGVSNGTLSLNASTGEVTYDPDDNFNGSDSFTFTVTDDGTTDGNSDALTSTAATVSITVNAVNDVPNLTTINDQETSEETDMTVDLSGSDVDIVTNGQTLTFTATSSDPSIVTVSTTSTGSSTATLSLDVQDLSLIHI